MARTRRALPNSAAAGQDASGVRLVDHNTGNEHFFGDVDEAEASYRKMNASNHERGFPANYSVFDADNALLSRDGKRS